ncbi:MAG TPA: hypothetical protein VK554_07790, partial [Bradyrhizobium sp.]|nr:hypothetical protein [Bradyrhizobium sp.]
QQKPKPQNSEHTPPAPSVIASEAKQSILSLRPYGLLRGACHRARIRATRWLHATTKREGEQNALA